MWSRGLESPEDHIDIGHWDLLTEVRDAARSDFGTTAWLILLISSKDKDPLGGLDFN